MGKTRRKKKLEKRKNYNPSGGKIAPPGGRLFGFEQRLKGDFPEEGDWLIGQMYLLIKEVDNSFHDNWRWCSVDDRASQMVYQERLSDGCCGFADKKVTHPKSGRVYKIGFNFGH